MSTPKPRRELDALLSRSRHTPAELCRIAELTEIVDSDEAALYWWHEAAVAGDQEAIDYLEMLDQERQPRPATAPPMPTLHTPRTIRTITERYGRKRVTIFFVCTFVVLGAIGWVKSSSLDAGPPACAMQYRDVRGASGDLMNKMVECDDAVDRWCAKNHPENPDDCSNAVLIDGDARNVGKD